MLMSVIGHMDHKSMLRYYQPHPTKLAMIAEEYGRVRDRDRGGAGRAPHRLSVSSAIRRSAAKPIISRRNVETEPFSSRSRRAILSLVNPVAVLEFRMCLDNPTLVQHRRSDHRLGQVTRLRQTSGGRFGGRLTHRSYTTPGDTTPRGKVDSMARLGPPRGAEALLELAIFATPAVEPGVRRATIPGRLTGDAGPHAG